MNTGQNIAGILLFPTLLISGAARAADVAAGEDCTAPCLAYSLSLETDLETILARKPTHSETTNIGPSDSLTLTATPVENLNVVADFVLESVLDADVDQVNVAEDVGLYADELYAEYAVGTFGLKAGKFSPVFSFASENLGGNYGSTFASSFDSSESWATQVSASFDTDSLKNQLSATIFTSDRSFLSESILTNRGRTALDDGGAGNVKGLGSAQLLWDGCSGADPADCWSDGTYGYRLGARWQKAGDGATHDEWAYTAAYFHGFEMGGHAAKIVAEGDYTYHLGGEDDGLAALTLGTEVDLDPVTLYAAVELQDNLFKGAPDKTGFALDIAADYAIAENWTLGVGYAYVDTGADDTAHYLNLSVTLDLEGNIGGKS
jgi:hypothetical protein